MSNANQKPSPLLTGREWKEIEGKLTHLPQKCLSNVFPEVVSPSAYRLTTSSPRSYLRSELSKRKLCAKALPLARWQLEQWHSTAPLSTPVTLKETDLQRQVDDLVILGCEGLGDMIVGGAWNS